MMQMDRKMPKIFSLIVLYALFCPFSVFGLDYYMNGSTGTDSATCGQLPTTPCKTIKKALENIPDGQVTIKIARGVYEEDHLDVLATPSIDNKVVFESGWNADFTSHSCNTSGTTIMPGYTSNQGWPVFFISQFPEIVTRPL